VAALAAFTVQFAGAANLPEFMTPTQLQAMRAEQIARAASAQTDVAKSETPTLYTGKISDADSGGYLFKYRNYNPEMNRWTTVDPSGFPDGASNFLYTNNSAIAFFDPDGLYTIGFASGRYELYKEWKQEWNWEGVGVPLETTYAWRDTGESKTTYGGEDPANATKPAAAWWTSGVVVIMTQTSPITYGNEPHPVPIPGDMRDAYQTTYQSWQRGWAME
jgi:RHS repeat-associated protein